MSSPQISTLAAEQRQESRAAVDFGASFAAPGQAGRAMCRVADLSAGGARLRLYCDLATDAVIALALPGAGIVRARVIWRKGSEAGCQFEAPLPGHQCDALRERGLLAN